MLAHIGISFESVHTFNRLCQQNFTVFRNIGTADHVNVTEPFHIQASSSQSYEPPRGKTNNVVSEQV